MKAPKAKDIQIRHTPHGRLSVRCRHGWELANDTAFALILWNAAWNEIDQEDFDELCRWDDEDDSQG